MMEVFLILFFQKHQYLFKSKIDPKQLVILNDEFAKETVNKIASNLNPKTETIIEQQRANPEILIVFF